MGIGQFRAPDAEITGATVNSMEIQRPIPGTFMRGAARLLYAEPGIIAESLEEILTPEYDTVWPWTDLGASKTGLYYQGFWVWTTQIAVGDWKPCDIPLLLGDEFSLAFLMQAPTGAIRYRAMPSCSLTEDCIQNLESDAVRENFLKRGECAAAPIEFRENE